MCYAETVICEYMASSVILKVPLFDWSFPSMVSFTMLFRPTVLLMYSRAFDFFLIYFPTSLH